MAISGTGVAVATFGGLLIYAGLSKQGLAGALRAISTGHPSLPQAATPRAATIESLLGQGAAAGIESAVGSGGGLPALVTAAYQYQGDQYSQLKRWQAGYSDCSSFVGKAFKVVGITPPGASTTLSYLGWSQLSKINVADAGAGDLLCNSSHIVICINGSMAIGQENPTLNVSVGSYSDLMAGTGAYTALRYTPSGADQGRES